MKTTNKKLSSALMLVFIFIILLSTVAYAKPFTDAFKGALTKINDFFASEQYKTYTKTIDFFIFSILFVSIYMGGVKYAFKEVKRIERVIAVVLGLTTAFLLVIGNFSIVALLPFVNWFLYILLFILILRLLKGIKSKFWRFVLALILTLLVIAFAQFLYGALTPPEIRGPGTGPIQDFFTSFEETLKSVDVSESQRVPEYLRQTTQPSPTTTITPQERGVLKEVPTPKEKKEEAPKAEEKTSSSTTPSTLPTPTSPTQRQGEAQPILIPQRGYVEAGVFSFPGSNLVYIGGAIMLLISIIALIKKKGLLKRKEKTKIREMIDHISTFIQNKKLTIDDFKEINDDKVEILRDVHVEQAIITRLAKEDVPKLYEEETKKDIEGEEHYIKEFIKIERRLFKHLKYLAEIEQEFLRSFEVWKKISKGWRNFDISQFEVKFIALIRNWLPRVELTREELEQIGILYLIYICFNVGKREYVLAEDIEELLKKKNIVALVQGKYKTEIEEERRLTYYAGRENLIIDILENKIKLQVELLERLQQELKEEEDRQFRGREEKGRFIKPGEILRQAKEKGGKVLRKIKERRRRETPEQREEQMPEAGEERPASELLNRINQTLAASTEPVISYIASVNEVLDYLKTLILPGRARIRELRGELVQDRLRIEGSISTPLGSANFRLELANSSEGELEVSDYEVNLPLLLRSTRGRIESYLANLNERLTKQINNRIDPSWKLVRIILLDYRNEIAFVFSKREPPTPGEAERFEPSPPQRGKGLIAEALERAEEERRRGTTGTGQTREKRLRELSADIDYLYNYIRGMKERIPKFKRNLEEDENRLKILYDDVTSANKILLYPTLMETIASERIEVTIFRDLWNQLLQDHLSIPAFVDNLITSVEEVITGVESRIAKIEKFRLRRRLIKGAVVGAGMVVAGAGGLLAYPRWRKAQRRKRIALTDVHAEIKYARFVKEQNQLHINYNIKDPKNLYKAYIVTIYIESADNKFSMKPEEVNPNTEFLRPVFTTKIPRGKYKVYAVVRPKDNLNLFASTDVKEIELK